MKFKTIKAITAITVFSFLITAVGCTINDISVEKPSVESSSQSETSQTTNTEGTTAPAQIYPMVLRPKIGEQFPLTSFVKSGALLATVNNAKVYTNLYEAGAKWEDMFEDFRTKTDGTSALQADFFDRESGDFLESAVYGKTAFVVVELTLENRNAVSIATDFNIPGTPALYGDDVFRIDTFDICPLKEKNSENPNNVGNFMPLLWCDIADSNSEIHPFAVTIPNGESITLKIGTMVQQTVFDEATQKRFGGQLGDDLLSRMYLSTSMSKNTSMVHLELNSNS